MNEFTWMTEEELKAAKIELPKKTTTEREDIEAQLKELEERCILGGVFGSLEHKTILAAKRRLKLRLKNL